MNKVLSLRKNKTSVVLKKGGLVTKPYIVAFISAEEDVTRGVNFGCEII